MLKKIAPTTLAMCGAIMIVFALVLVGCDKKKDQSVAKAGGGASSQSVFTAKGAAR